MSLIDIKNLSFAYDGSAEKVFDNVSFQIDTGWPRKNDVSEAADG
mgnify:CR=1 FL=1